jgi:hypothetical protein
MNVLQYRRQFVHNTSTFKCLGLTYKHLLNMSNNSRPNVIISGEDATERIAVSKYTVNALIR